MLGCLGIVLVIGVILASLALFPPLGVAEIVLLAIVAIVKGAFK